jgi:hypothetical protein
VTTHPDLGVLIDDGEGPFRTAARRVALTHVAACADCRARVAAVDPTRLFALLALEPVPGRVLQRFSAGLEQELRAESARRQVRRRTGLAALAASLLLAALLSTYLAGRPAAAATPAAMFEVLDSPGAAQVVRMDLGGTELVMIFDEALDL